ncbi:v-ATPase subunit C [Oesophagostomum dentatum]|uniref:V-type proton ATPase subunit C n=1 Tax=Oesophagostomum dentatum TaxID=61180 RepID=A0A0B1TT14_OESDE|nr:v-ATPase subunit C [Oesophagostomum dentatum]
MSVSSGEYWLISAPGEKGANDAWDKLNRATSNLSNNSKFNIPDLKVGTLDQLVGLSDDLSKLDSTAEGVTRKLVQYFGDVLEDDRSKLAENLLINNKDIKTYVTKFQWEGAKYPLKQSLKVLSEIIGKQVTQIDNDLKQKSLAYNNLKNSLASIDRKTTGSLITKDLADIVKADDFVLNSEYLQTLMVVVPKLNAKEWEQKYATFTSMVVPGSSRLITEEGEHALYSVTLFKKVIDEFKMVARENKFIVRDFVYDEESLKAGKNERDKLVAEKQRQYAPLIRYPYMCTSFTKTAACICLSRWLKINFGEIFAAYIHVKALRVFVESVLRYGLPVNFQAAVVEPAKGSQKKLRAELHKLYIHLDGSAAGPIDTLEDSPALMSLGVNEYYPYVFFKLNLDFVDKK